MGEVGLWFLVFMLLGARLFGVFVCQALLIYLVIAYKKIQVGVWLYWLSNSYSCYILLGRVLISFCTRFCLVIKNNFLC